MWNGTKVTNWILSLKPQDLLIAFKISVVAFSILYGFCFGYAVGVLFLVLCLVAFKLPIIIIHFNQLYLGTDITSLPEEIKKPKALPKPSNPYFIIEDGPISSEVNQALESFLNGVVEKFIIQWHSSLEVKEELFVNEVRHVLKYIVIRFYQLLENIDFPNLILDKIIPAFLWHLDCYSTGLERSYLKEIEKYVLECFGTNLHPALSSRKSEEVYLKHCSGEILKDILPPQLKSSKLLTILLRDILSCQILQNAMDAIANPENINRLIIIWLDDNNPVLERYNAESDSRVPMLKNFTNDCPPNPKEMCMYPSLSSILKTPPHLYQLMQFLKRINTLKYLQFCFAVDEFNEKLLNPDLKLEQMERLKLMGQKMFEIYFCHTSPDCIGFENESKDQMKSIVYASASEIVRLRTSSTLFQAYDYVMDILEQKILPRFYRSPEFYQLVTGAQQSSGSSKSAKKKDETVSTGWGKKLRAALRPSWLGADTKLAGNPTLDPEEECNYDTGIDLTEADFIADDLDADDSAGTYADLIPVSGRDLTAWKTSIPRVVSAVDSAGKPIWAFEVEIQRGDIRPEDDPEEYHWTVIRTYLEFFHLENKLTEFHGGLVSNRLPQKKMFGTRNMKYLESVRPEFESFLRSLLKQPALKGSDLIFSFLTLSDLAACQATGDSSTISSNLLPDLGFGRMMRHVPMKLRKERGQDLDSFLQTFIASTESPKPKPSKVEVRDPSSSEVSLPVIKELHPIFKNNGKTFQSQEGSSSRGALSRVVYIPTLRGPYECILFAAGKILRIPQLLWSLMIGLRSLLSFHFDSYVRKHVKDKWTSIVQADKITVAINLLQEAVLSPTSSENKQDIKSRQKAWSCVVQNIPTWLGNIFGTQPIVERCELIFHCLQFPVLNKQLSYVLLDILLNETFPDIFSNDASNPSSS